MTKAPPFKFPSVGLARRNQGTFWILHGFDRPQDTDLPLGPLVGPTGDKVDSEDHQVPMNEAKDPCWWTNGAPWAGNTPVGSWVLEEQLTWVLGQDYAEFDLDLEQSGRTCRARASQDSREAAERLQSFFTDNWNKAITVFPTDYPRPKFPNPLSNDWFSDKQKARQEVDRYRQESLSVVALFIHAVAWDREFGAGDLGNGEDILTLLNAILPNSSPRGHCFDPTALLSSERALVDQWLRYGVPFAYLWSPQHELNAEIREFSPWSENAQFEISNHEVPAEHLDVFASVLGDTKGEPLSDWDAKAAETICAYERYENQRYKIDLRVFYRAAAIPKDYVKLMERAWKDEGEETSPTSRNLGTNNVHFFPDALAHRKGQPLSWKVTAFVRRAADPTRFWEYPTSFSDPIADYRQDANDVVMASPEMLPAACPRNINGHSPRALPTQDELIKRHQLLYAVREEAIKNEWYNEGRIEPDVLKDVAVGCCERFCNASTISYPPATELKLAQHLLGNEDSLRSNLLMLCLRSGMPVTVRFAVKYGRRMQDQARRELSERPARGMMLPGWRRERHIQGAVFPNFNAPGRFFAAFWDALERVASYPQMRRVLFYGGLTWRLAIEFVGAHLAEDAAMGPSEAWKLVEAGPLFDLKNGLHTEVFELASDDELVRILHGTFPDGTSLWPPQEVFMRSWRWRGEWTSENEKWFQQRLEELRGGKDSPLQQNQWSAVIQEPLRDVRHSGRDVPIHEEVMNFLGKLRESGVLEGTLMNEDAHMPWNEDSEE